LIPHIKYAELSKRGYLLFDVTNQKVQGDWIYMNTITSRTFTSNTAASWCDLDGANHMTQCGSALTPRGTNPILAPVVTDVKNVMKDNMVMISCFPNPTENEVRIQYYLYKPTDVNIQMTNMNGQTVYSQVIKHKENGLFNAEADMSSLAKGIYLMSVTAGGKVYTKKVVKN
jgi:hypothetical protein